MLGLLESAAAGELFVVGSWEFGVQRQTPNLNPSVDDLPHAQIPADAHRQRREIVARASGQRHQRLPDAQRPDPLGHKAEAIAQIPIKLPITVEDKKLASRIATDVRAIMASKVKLRDANRSDRDRTSLEREVDFRERRIDEDVFRLYGVEGLPDSRS